MKTKNRFAALQGAAPVEEVAAEPRAGRRPLGERKVVGGRARNEKYEALTIYLPTKVKKKLRFYLKKDEDASEILEAYILHWIAVREAEDDDD